MPVKFTAESGHRVSGGRVDAYGRVSVNTDGSWQGFAHTNMAGGVHIAGGGQRGTVLFFDGAGNNIYTKELWNFNIDVGGDREDNVGGGPNDIPSNIVTSAARMGFAITDGDHHVDWLGTLQQIGQAAQAVMTIVEAIG